MVQVSVVLYFTCEIDGLPVFPMFKVDSLAKETLLKGKALYSWPPNTNLYRSAPFYIENIIYIFNKTSYLNEEVNCTEPSPSVSVPWPKHQLTALYCQKGFVDLPTAYDYVLCLVFCNKDKTWKANGTAASHLLSNVLYFIG